MIDSLDKKFFDKLRNKYNYDDKTMNALAKIVPCIVDYYGEEHEFLILEAVLNTKIIACNSKQTISKVIAGSGLTEFVGGSSLYDIDLKKQESVYVPSVKVIYNEEINSYVIDKIDRIIVTSHTFNYDSPKGLEVLTHALCHLVKSYKDEFKIDENMLSIRSGIAYEKRKIMYGDEISLDFVSNFGNGLEEGFTILDTELIVSMVLHDSYKCYDYDSIYMIAYILKEKYGFIGEINNYEICGDVDSFKRVYKKSSIERLADICDDCVSIENDMHLSYTREDKDSIASILKNKLEKDAYTELVSIYEESREVVKN